MSEIRSVTPALPWQKEPRRGCDYGLILDDNDPPHIGPLKRVWVDGGRLDKVGWRFLCRSCQADPRVVITDGPRK